jgi:predicted phage terminase large subunit-like protein
VGGTATGEGGSRLLLDDPHGAQDAQSDAMRESALEWFDMVWSTRRNDPKRDAMVTIMQRLHEGDVSGRILELGGWEHVCLPAEYDGTPRTSVLFPDGYDPRSLKGALLWPERFGEKELVALKQQLGEYGTAGQLQQDPVPRGGGILKVEHFQKWPAEKSLPAFEYVVQSYDCAYTEKTSGDPTACSVWAIFTHKGVRQGMLVDAWDEHLSYPSLRQKTIDEWHSQYGGDKTAAPPVKSRKADTVLVEAKASGQSLLQDLRLAKVPAIGYNPGNADKVSRAHQAAPTLELDLLWIPESRKNPGQFVSWAQPFLKQLAKFPVAEHDDYVDTFTQAIIYLKDGGWFELPQAEDDEVLEVDYEARRKARINPYAA